MPAELTPAEALACLRSIVCAAIRQTSIPTQRADEALRVLAAAVEDAELMDWLTEALRRSNIQLQTDYDTVRPGFSLHSATMNSTWGHPDLREALRAAIDAARTPAPGERS